jgi:branched-chain amino acid transport system substrate-binding protein
MESLKRYPVPIVIGFILMFTFFGGSVDAVEMIKIGVVAPLTGSFADEGNEMVRGVQMAVDELNTKGGLLGNKLEIIKGDIGDFSAEKIVSVAERIIHRDKVDFIVTQYLGGVADVKAFGGTGIPYLNMDTSQAEADLIKENIDKYWNIFQTCPPESKYALGIIDFMLRVFPKATGYKYPNNKIGLVTMIRAYNDRISAGFRELVKKNKWELAVDEKTPTGTVEWGAVLTKIRQEKPAIVFFNDHVPADEVSFLDQFHTNPTKSLVFIQYGPSNPAFISLGKEKTNGIFWGTLFAPYGPKGEAWKDRYRKKYKEEPGVGTAAGTYTSTMIWAEVVKKVGNVKDYEEVCRVIRESAYNITGNTHVFDPANQTAIVGEGLSAFLVYQVQNLKHQLASPISYATAKMQITPWMK